MDLTVNMLLDRTIDDMKRRCIDHRDLMNDPVGVLMEVAADMHKEVSEIKWTEKIR